MSRGSRRGCIMLKKAIVGIDDEDDCTFTIHSEGRTSHFQGEDRTCDVSTAWTGARVCVCVCVAWWRQLYSSNVLQGRNVHVELITQ